MNEDQKQAIIESGKQYFRTIIIPNHLKNLNKLHLSSFDLNPFLINYLAAFLCGDTQPVSLAKAFGEVVDEDGIDGSALILAKVEEFAEEIIQKGGL